MNRDYLLSVFFCISAFISHSASIPSINFLFKHALPDLSGKTLVDIGSRLGPLLYGVNCLFFWF